ncbi:hypothetical protein FRC01_013179 [Tulasnella sp. 417]|nr:hypothetical protein FRC01_013179 [Tulasnella sp. 417]
MRRAGRSGSPAVRRVRPSGSLYLDYQSWLAGDRKQSNQATFLEPATARSNTVDPKSGEQIDLRSTERLREGPSNPRSTSTTSNVGPKSAPSSLAVRFPTTKGLVRPRASRIPSDATVRGSHRTPPASSASGFVNRNPSEHAYPTIGSPLQIKEKVTPRSSAPTTPLAPKTTNSLQYGDQSPHEVTHYTESGLPSWNPLVDFIESQKLKKGGSQPASSSEYSPSPTPTKDTGYRSRKKDLRLAQGSGSSTMTDSDSPLHSPFSPTKKQAPSLHQECRRVLRELQRVAKADKATQETMKECLAELARCQERKETLVKRVEDLLDRAQYYETSASSIYGDEVQLPGEYSYGEETD